LEGESSQCSQDAGRASISFLCQFLDTGAVGRDETELSGDEETMSKDQRCYREQT
jgi:hypothetical protein